MDNYFKYNKKIIAYGQNCMNCKKKIRGQDNYFMEYLGIVCFECSNMSKVKYYLLIIEILQNKLNSLKKKIT